jgi:hypothetical protein
VLIWPEDADALRFAQARTAVRHVHAQCAQRRRRSLVFLQLHTHMDRGTGAELRGVGKQILNDQLDFTHVAL